MHPVDAKLAELGITLPEAPPPAANYVPWVIAGGLIHVSGQISQHDGNLIKGRLGVDFDVAEGAHAARCCAISILAQAKAAVGGDWSRVKRLVRLGGFVCSTADFTDQPKVINGASDLMVEVLGEAGRHARAAVSVPSLPLGVAVEIDAVFELA
jgi:enamine deaminase RidA (YjgF/YER057c/UK114 family)